MGDIKFEDWRLNVFWIAVAVATAIAGFVFGWCWRDRPGALASVSLLSAMTAFGTVGTATIATYLSWREASKNDRSEKLAAEIAQARVKPELTQLRIALSAAIWAVRRLALIDDFEPRNSGDLYLMGRLTESLLLPLSAEKCDLLLPAEPNSARQLSSILGEAVRVEASLAMVVGFGDTQPNGGGIATFLLLERICALGALVELFLGQNSSREFNLGTFREVARKLGIEEALHDRLAENVGR